MSKSKAEQALMDKFTELVDATLETHRLMRNQMAEIDDSLVTKKINEHLSLCKKSASWKNFSRPLISAPVSDWQIPVHLGQILPSTDKVAWFLVDLPLLSGRPIFEAEIGVIEEIVGKCRIFEYYVIAKDFSWVVAKNRHDEIFVMGEVVETNYGKLKNQPDS